MRSGVDGSWRFLNRVWRLLDQEVKNDKVENNTTKDLLRKTHTTIKKVTDDIEREFHFNTAISAIMELVNEIYKAREQGVDSDVLKDAIKHVVILLSPFVPHIAEEMWQNLGNKDSIFHLSWPEYDKGAIQLDEVELVVQVNGKMRAKLSVAAGLPEDELKNIVLADEKVIRWLQGKEIKKFLIIQGRLASIVI